MKYAGEKVEGLNIQTIVIPFNGKNHVFRAQCIRDYSDFDKFCKEPEPPVKHFPDGHQEKDFDDEDWSKLISDYCKLKADWVLMKSLEPSVCEGGIEWETVDETDSSTWCNVMIELQEAFPEDAVSRIVRICNEANLLNQRKITEATESFLASQEATQ